MGETQKKDNQDPEKENLDADDPKQDEEALKETSEDEIRDNIIKELDLDEFDDADKIDKLVKKEVESRKNLSTAIRQKINWRKKVEDQTTTEPPQKKGDEATRQVVEEALDERKLEEMDLVDETKFAIKAYAKANSVSISTALKSDYFNFLKVKEDEKKREEEASISRTHKTHTGRNWNELTEKDFDLSTEEGRKDYTEWKKQTGRTG